MKTGFIIINYNDSKSTIHLLNSIKHYKCIDKIVVVDNNSTDDSLRCLENFSSSKIKILASKENRGYSSGINLGVKYLIEKYNRCNIAISNADIIIEKEDDLSSLFNILNKEEIAVVAPTVIEHGKKNRGWRLPTFTLDICSSIPYLGKKIQNKYSFYPDNYYENESSYVDVVSGCFFLIKSDVLEKINYFDENVFLYYEENILGFKLKELNYKSVIANEITIIHNHSVTIDKNFKKIGKLRILKTSQEYFEKTYNKANIIKRISLHVVNRISLFIYWCLSICQK